MRARLIAVGAAIAIIGAGVIIAVTLPNGSPQDTHDGLVSLPQIHPGLSSWVQLNVTPTDRGSVSFRWTSTQTAAVEWYATTSYYANSTWNWKIVGGPLKSWANNTSGQWTITGVVDAVYTISIRDTSNHTLNFTTEFEEDISNSGALLPTLPMAVSVAGGALLVGMGGIAIYLGLFLPSGVYDPDDGEPGAEFEDAASEVSEEPPHGHSSRPPPW